MIISDNGGPVDGYVAVQYPHEFFGNCDGVWNPSSAGAWNLVDYPLAHPEVACKRTGTRAPVQSQLLRDALGGRPVPTETVLDEAEVVPRASLSEHVPGTIEQSGGLRGDGRDRGEEGRFRVRTRRVDR